MIRAVLLFTLFVTPVMAEDGAAIYKARCATCHDGAVGRAPATSALRLMPVPLVLRSLESGSMQTAAAGLSAADRYAVTLYLAVPATQPAVIPASALCGNDKTPYRDSTRKPNWNGWSNDLANTRFQNARDAGITAAELPRLGLKWAFGLGSGIVARSQPSVAGGRMFFGTQTGTVYSLDARSGCIHWSFEADGNVRTVVAIGANSGPANRATVYFGDEHALMYALDAATGKLAWKVHVEEHFSARITGTPQLHGGVLYVPVSSIESGLPGLPSYECCTFRGSVVALDATTGQQIWKTYTIAQAPAPTKVSNTGAQLHGPSGASVWSTPTFDERLDVLYVGTGNNYSDPASLTSDAVLALDSKTGEILWSRQFTANDTFNDGCSLPGRVNCPDTPGPDFDVGQPPILVTLPNGRRALVVGQKSGMVHAIDPDQKGEVLWQTRVGKGGPLGGVHWGSAADGRYMYVALSDVQIKGIVLDSTEPQGFRLALDPNQGGGLFALDLTTGAIAWVAKPSLICGERNGCSPAQSAAVTAIPGAVFSGSLDGHLRAYAASTGYVLWDVDTVREYDTVNASKARGGSLDGPGAVVVGGMLYVSSGYGQFGGAPGNVLLAFSVDGE